MESSVATVGIGTGSISVPALAVVVGFGDARLNRVLHVRQRHDGRFQRFLPLGLHAD